MEDLISRQAAIDVVVQSLVDWDGMFRQEANCRIRDAINELPSADRQQGEWIDNGDRYYRCSLCGTRDTDTWDWCHGCGCRMKGADDE